MPKGSDYERELCNAFSRWWTGGQRDDIFWRAAGSGNRAKVRGRLGRGTAGQHGDICATDPIGAPLIDLFTIEIKRGYSANTIHDLMDKPDKAGAQCWDNFLDQVLESHEQAGSFSWLLINRRDRREAIVWFPRYCMDAMREHGVFTAARPHPYAGINLTVRRYNGTKTILGVCGMRLEDWFNAIKPENLKGMAREV